jgi:hypothetical protein
MDPEASGGKDRQKAARRAFFEARLPPVRNSGAWLWPSHGLTYIATVTQISAYAEQVRRHPTIAEQADDPPLASRYPARGAFPSLRVRK